MSKKRGANRANVGGSAAGKKLVSAMKRDAADFNAVRQHIHELCEGVIAKSIVFVETSYDTVFGEVVASLKRHSARADRQFLTDCIALRNFLARAGTFNGSNGRDRFALVDAYRELLSRVMMRENVQNDVETLVMVAQALNEPADRFITLATTGPELLGHLCRLLLRYVDDVAVVRECCVLTVPLLDRLRLDLLDVPVTAVTTVLAHHRGNKEVESAAKTMLDTIIQRNLKRVPVDLQIAAMNEAGMLALSTRCVLSAPYTASRPIGYTTLAGLLRFEALVNDYVCECARDHLLAEWYLRLFDPLDIQVDEMQFWRRFTMGPKCRVDYSLEAGGILDKLFLWMHNLSAVAGDPAASPDDRPVVRECLVRLTSSLGFLLRDPRGLTRARDAGVMEMLCHCDLLLDDPSIQNPHRARSRMNALRDAVRLLHDDVPYATLEEGEFS